MATPQMQKRTARANGSNAPIPKEELVFDRAERRDAVLRLIAAARQRIALSVFRCDDFKVLDALDDAVRRNVRVEVLMTPRAKGWGDKLGDLELFLESMGANVNRFSDPVVKYHAKYVVVDDRAAMVGSLNLTRKCFARTCDFALITRDPGIVAGLRALFDVDRDSEGSRLPDAITERLIISPQRARRQFHELIEGARKSVWLIDRRVEDPGFLHLLKDIRARGVDVRVLGGETVGDMQSHGRLLIVDGQVAVIGSISLEAPALDFRREVAVVVQERTMVASLVGLFRELQKQ